MQNNTDKLDNQQRNKSDKGEDEGNVKRQKTEENGPQGSAGKDTNPAEKNKQGQNSSSGKPDADRLKSQMKGSDADHDVGSIENK